MNIEKLKIVLEEVKKAHEKVKRPYELAKIVYDAIMLEINQKNDRLKELKELTKITPTYAYTSLYKDEFKRLENGVKNIMHGDIFYDEKDGKAVWTIVQSPALAYVTFRELEAEYHNTEKSINEINLAIESLDKAAKATQNC